MEFLKIELKNIEKKTEEIDGALTYVAMIKYSMYNQNHWIEGKKMVEWCLIEDKTFSEIKKDIGDDALQMLTNN